MADLADYSGPFKPDLKMTDFTKEALVRLWKAAGKQYCGLDGIWYGLIKERWGEEAAAEMDAEVWRRMTPLEVGWTREALSISGDDVEAVMKWAQVDIGTATVMPELKCELRSEKTGIMTVQRCQGLDYFERHGEIKLLKNACQVVDVEGFQKAANLFNKNIKCTPLKLPPRQSPDEIACQWQFELTQ